MDALDTLTTVIPAMTTKVSGYVPLVIGLSVALAMIPFGKKIIGRVMGR